MFLSARQPLRCFARASAAAAESAPQPAVCRSVDRAGSGRTDTARTCAAGGRRCDRGSWLHIGSRCSRRGGSRVGSRGGGNRFARRGLLDWLRLRNVGLVGRGRLVAGNLPRRTGAALAIGAFGSPPSSQPLGVGGRGQSGRDGKDGKQQNGTHRGGALSVKVGNETWPRLDDRRRSSSFRKLAKLRKAYGPKAVCQGDERRVQRGASLVARSTQLLAGSSGNGTSFNSGLIICSPISCAAFCHISSASPKT